MPPLPALLDDALRWRPIVPEALVDRALRQMRAGLATQPDGTVRPMNFSLPAIERTRTLMLRQQQVLDPAPRELQREELTLASCTAQRLTLPASRLGYVLLYFHGGAYLRGSTDTHIGALSRFMRAGRVEAFSVDYRMEPEHRFPAWVDDAVDAYQHLTEQLGIAPSRIALGGDSAGGGVTMALVQRIAELGLPAPACAAVISPWVDLTCSGPSHTENAKCDAMFGPGVIDHTAQWLADQAGVSRAHPLLSPAFGEYAGAPPLRIDASATELLRSDAELLADAYRESGASVDLVLHPRAPHAWTAIGGLRAARQTAREIGAFIDARLA